MLVPDPLLFKLGLILRLIELLEDIFKPAIILLEDCILGAQIQRQPLQQGHVEARFGEAPDRFIRVVHGQSYPAVFVVVDLDLGWRAAGGGGENHLERAGLGDDQVFGPVLVAVGVAADDDRFLPVADEAGDAGDDDRFAEDCAAEDVADCCGRWLDGIFVGVGRRRRRTYCRWGSTTSA